MWFLDDIVEWLEDASDLFYSLYREVYDWVWPFWLAAWFFYNLSEVFISLASRFSYFDSWVEDAADQLGDILSWSNIRSLIRSWLPDLEDVVDWWEDWWKKIEDVVSEWWKTSRATVQGWIDAAGDAFQAQIDGLFAQVGDIQNWVAELLLSLPDVSEVLSWFEDWWGKILANLEDWWGEKVKEVEGMIDSAFVARDGLFAGWQDWRVLVIDFFTDPLEWLWTRFTDWFLGPEE